MTGCWEFLWKFCISIFIIGQVIYYLSLPLQERDDNQRIQNELNNKVEVMK